MENDNEQLCLYPADANPMIDRGVLDTLRDMFDLVRSSSAEIN